MTDEEKNEITAKVYSNVYKDETVERLLLQGRPTKHPDEREEVDGLAFYLCYSDVQASRFVLTAGTLILSAISAMV